MQVELLDVDDDVATVAVRGEVDLSNHLELHAVVEDLVGAHALRTVVLDVADLSFIDSHGVRALMLLQEHTLAGRATIVLRRPRPHLCRLLDIIGVSSLFEVVPSPTLDAHPRRA